MSSIATKLTVAEVRRMIARAMVSNPAKTLNIAYENRDGQIKEREVEPYEIREGRDGLVLFAHCLLAESQGDAKPTRQFALAKMHTITLGRPFSPRHPIVMDT